MRRKVIALLSFVVAGLWGLTAAPEAARAQCPVQIDTFRSLVVNDAALDKDKFSFRTTIKKILSTSEAPTSEPEQEALVNSIIRTFRKKMERNSESGLATSLDVREEEAALFPRDLLDPANASGMVPVGLFNRWDLAPNTFGTCGEHRIVYAMKPGGVGRFFLIFEAALPNPKPGEGVNGCRPVAEFWQRLSTIAAPADRAKELEKFYFEGLPGFRPVVHVGNFGGDGAGQLRGNLFVTRVWQLREWRAQISPTTLVPEFLAETVKNNPLPEFYAKEFTLSTELRALLGAEADAAEAIGKEELLRYQGEFLRSYIASLLVVDDNGNVALAPEDIINRLGLGSDNRYNEFQSTSDDGRDLPSEIIKTNPKFKELVETMLAHFQRNVDASKQATFDHLMHRAAVGTCAGCHQTAADKKEIAPGLKFPGPAGIFVHIKENGDLSPALTNHFLPFRKKILFDALCPPAAVTAAAPPAGAPPAPATDVKKLLRALRQETSVERRLQLGAEVERAIRLQRAKEYAAPGAFVRNRRPH